MDKSKDPNFWSVQVSRDLRIVVHKVAGRVLLAYVAIMTMPMDGPNAAASSVTPGPASSRSRRCAN
jgi:hypothetical protein